MHVRSSLTIRTAFVFFVPLILTTELHQLSHSLVHAFLARLGDPTTTLAAFSVAFSFNTTFGAIIAVCTPAGLSYITDKPSFWRMARFFFCMSLAPFFLIETVALTPIGDWLFGEMMGASAEVTRLAKGASALMALWIFPNQVRNITTALIMMHRRTVLISHATTMRLVSQALMLMGLPFLMEGALAGAASLVGCMTVEAIYLCLVSRHMYAQLPAKGGEHASYRQMWVFSWPLMITSIIEHGVVFIVNFFLGRLANPDLALAAFGVANALTSLVVSPLRNLVHTAQALVHSREDMRVMLRFVHQLTLVYIVLVAALFYTPMRDVILNGVMGLPAELSSYATPAVQMMMLVAIVWGYSSLFRGLLSAMRRTRVIAASAVIRLLATVAVGSVTLISPNLNGAVVGIVAIAAAFFVEALILGWQLARYSSAASPMFPHGIEHKSARPATH